MIQRPLPSPSTCTTPSAANSQGRTAAAERCSWAARRFLEALARQRPVLVVFEDMHWAEPSLLNLVESLALPARAVAHRGGLQSPARNCSTSDQRPAWTTETDLSVSIQLAPLGDDPAAALLDTLIAGYAIAPVTRARLLGTAAGNPLYLEQLAASLSEQGGSDNRPVLPPTIHALCPLGSSAWGRGPAASSSMPLSSARTSGAEIPGTAPGPGARTAHPKSPGSRGQGPGSAAGIR